MTRRPPDVTVVIPAYDCEATIGLTIESVLAQTGVSFEVVVVDDGSTDGTAEVVRGFGPRVRLVSQANGGVGAARNHGLALARGRWVAFCDADDFWEPEKLARQVRVLSRGWPLGLCYTGVQLLDETGAQVHLPWAEPGPRPEGWAFRELLLADNPICTSSVMVDRALVQRLGGFVTDPGQSEDYDMWLKVARHATLAYLPARLTLYRVLPGSYYRGDPRVARFRTLTTLDQADRRWGLSRDRRLAKALARRRAWIFFDLAYELSARGEVAAARRYLLRSLALYPMAPRVLTHLVLSTMPQAVRGRALEMLRGLLRTSSAP